MHNMYGLLKKAAPLFVLPFAANASPCFDASVGAEALYWKPCHDAFRYGFFSANPDGTGVPQNPLDLIPDYQWGFRIFGSICEPTLDYSVSLEWAHVSDSSAASAQGRPDRFLNQFLYDSDFGQNVTSLSAREHSRYNKLGLKVAYGFCSSLYVYGGARWIDIALREQSKGIFETGSVPIEVKQIASFNGGALEAGIGANFCLWSGLGIALRFGAFGIIGEQQTSLFVDQGEEIATDQTSRLTQCLRGLEVRLGIQYAYQCGCWWLRWEIGYELDAYFNALRLHLPQLTAANIGSSNFTIGGPYAGVTIGF